MLEFFVCFLFVVFFLCFLFGVLEPVCEVRVCVRRVEPFCVGFRVVVLAALICPTPSTPACFGCTDAVSFSAPRPQLTHRRKRSHHRMRGPTNVRVDASCTR